MIDTPWRFHRGSPHSTKRFPRLRTGNICRSKALRARLHGLCKTGRPERLPLIAAPYPIVGKGVRLHHDEVAHSQFTTVSPHEASMYHQAIVSRTSGEVIGARCSPHARHQQIDTICDAVQSHADISPHPPNLKVVLHLQRSSRH